MCFNSVLIQVSSDNSFQQRIHWAQKLTSAENSRIHGVYFQSGLSTMAEAAPDLVMAPEGVAYVPEIAKNSKTILKEDLQNVRKLINASSLDDKSFHWMTVPGELAEQLPLVSLTHDLVVLSRNWFNGYDKVKLNSLLPDLSASLSAPLLVLPEHVPEHEFFKKPLVVWDNSAQAARALKSALPLLTKVGTTGIFCDFHGSDEYDIVALEEVASWLECHGITVTTVNSAQDNKSLSASIHDVVAENNHDIVIIGAQQESMLRNMVFGNQTEQVLAQSSVPVLINN
ncbi:universal stress protein [Planctobacterium marinum]|uniref:UspA domain-containing protein n=1 Tax=Planctobacterium marinum TaxID=1631968 RepID=A0AA48KT14_9ALTE|nr:hypothetical protein MACH26_25750 [Planctobacterium marinum]